MKDCVNKKRLLILWILCANVTLKDKSKIKKLLSFFFFISKSA